MNVNLINNFNIKNENDNKKQLSNKKEIIPDAIKSNYNYDDKKNNIIFKKYKN